MRILWSEQDSWFYTEIPPGENWRDDMELVRSVGFKTIGPPNWTWHTSKYTLLEKLRDHNPKSGLTITELALSKYKFLKEQAEKKAEVKKAFEQEMKAAEERAPSKWPQYKDSETGITCFIVEPAAESFVWKYVAPEPPPQTCFICGSPLYMFDLDDICLWCEKKDKEKA